MPRGIGLYAARQERVLVAAKSFLRLSNDSRQALSFAFVAHEKKSFREWQQQWHEAQIELQNAVAAADGTPYPCDPKECAT